MHLKRVLIADSDLDKLDELGAEFTAHGCDASLVSSVKELVALLQADTYDAVIIDLALSDANSLLAAQAMADQCPGLAVVVTGARSVLARRAAELSSSGLDVVQKPFNVPQLLNTVQRTVEVRRLREENKALRDQWEEREGPDDVASRSPRMVDALRQAATAADTSDPVAICGPAGTEKDVVALYIHRCGARARGPFVRFECGRDRAAFEEAQLFGRASRDANGVEQRHSGRLGVADGGTLFLDNVEELSPGCQAKLLRFIGDGQFLPAGEADGRQPPPRVDVRIVSALLHDPRTSLDDAPLRQDLLYRLNAFSISIPPLRERPDDVLPLAKRFLRRFTLETSKNIHAIAGEAQRLLTEYDWPGNVAELRDCIRTAVTGARHDVLLPEDLLRGPCRTELSGVIGGVTGPTLEDAQRQLILKTLNETHGDHEETARRLRIAATALTAKLDRYEAEGLIASAAIAGGEVKKC